MISDAMIASSWFSTESDTFLHSTSRIITDFARSVDKACFNQSGHE